jgi:hypothetical protein
MQKKVTARRRVCNGSNGRQSALSGRNYGLFIIYLRAMPLAKVNFLFLVTMDSQGEDSPLSLFT